MNNSRGFTLMEVLVVVALIGIIAAIAAPSLTTFVPNYRLKGEARDMYSQLQRARNEAVKTNTTVTFNFTPGVGVPCQGGRYVFTTTAGNVLVDRTMPDGICLFSGTGFPTAYRSNGLPAVWGRIDFSHVANNRTYQITMSPAGGITLQ